MTRRSEFDLIAALRARLPASGDRVVVGSGDDAAVVRAAGSHSVVSIDTTVDGVHARLDLGDPLQAAHDFGWRALTTALSDLAAMGAGAGEAYVALTLPKAFPDERVLAIADGLGAAATRYGVAVVGGDVTAGPVVVATVTVVGWAEARDGGAGARGDAGVGGGAGGEVAVLTRAGARPGDLVGVTGPIGSAAGGLALLLGHVPDTVLPGPDATTLQAAHLRPEPHLAAGVALLAAGASAAIDLSDGLLADAGHLARASGVDLILDEDLIPLGPSVDLVAVQLGQDPLRFAATAGEDFVLLVTVPPARRAAAESAGVVAWIGQAHAASRRGGPGSGEGEGEGGPRVTIAGASSISDGPGGHDHRA